MSTMPTRAFTVYIVIGAILFLYCPYMTGLKTVKRYGYIMFIAETLTMYSVSFRFFRYGLSDEIHILMNKRLIVAVDTQMADCR